MWRGLKYLFGYLCNQSTLIHFLTYPERIPEISMLELEKFTDGDLSENHFWYHVSEVKTWKSL